MYQVINLIEFNEFAKHLKSIGLSEKARLINDYVTYKIVG